MATAPPRVKLITIDGLFRQYNHRIPLHLDERVTVLHGRNGVGKTVTLKLVAALLAGDYETLARQPFERLRIDFADESFLSVRFDRRPEDEETSKRPKQRSSSTDLGRPTWSQLRLDYRIGGGHTLSTLVWLPFFMSSLKELRVGAAASTRTDRAVLTVQQSLFGDDELEPLRVRELRQALSVHFIEAQRLLRIASPEVTGDKTIPAITTAMVDIGQEMATRVQTADSTYRSTSTRLDDSLPARLFAPPKNGAKIPKKELRQRSEALEAERRRLHGIGILPDTTAFNPSTLTDAQRAMFIVYLKDNEEKLAVFKDLADRAEILLGTLNRKLSPKSIKLDKDLGYKVLSHDGRPLDLDALSSGEQHELVLLHTLLFRVEPGSFLLIDEPELSLHVTWQNEFLTELIQIAKKVGFDALVATHSPYIVGERRDLMVRLGEPV